MPLCTVNLGGYKMQVHLSVFDHSQVFHKERQLGKKTKQKNEKENKMM